MSWLRTARTQNATVNEVSRREADLFHGTMGGFEEFDPDMSGLGTHFGTQEAAETRLRSPEYGLSEEDLDAECDQCWGEGKDEEGESCYFCQGTGKAQFDDEFLDEIPEDAEIRHYELAVQNPLRLSDIKFWNKVDSVAAELRHRKIIDGIAYNKIVKMEKPEAWRALRQAIEAKGYDSVVYKNAVEDAGKDSYIVWDNSRLRRLDRPESGSVQRVADIAYSHPEQYDNLPEGSAHYYEDFPTDPIDSQEGEQRMREGLEDYPDVRILEQVGEPWDDAGAEYGEHGFDARHAASKGAQTLQALAPELAAAAQRIYDLWDASDETYGDEGLGVGFGGICHLIADDLAEIIYNKTGFAAVPQCSAYEQHVYVVVQADDGVYLVDIPYQYYERGGGFSWKKLPDVIFDASMVSIDHVATNPKEMREFVDEWEEPELDSDDLDREADLGRSLSELTDTSKPPTPLDVTQPYDQNPEHQTMGRASSKRVWRVQNEHGIGPDRAGAQLPRRNWSLIDLANALDSSQGRQPDPNKDFSQEARQRFVEAQGKMLFGFLNPEDAKAWYGEDDLTWLAEQGFQLVPVEAEEIFPSRSGKQVIFTPQNKGEKPQEAGKIKSRRSASLSYQS